MMELKSSDNAVLNRNMEFLKKYFPDVNNKVKEWLDAPCGYIEAVATKTGLPNLQISKEEKKIYLHSNYDPYKEAERLMDFDAAHNDTIIVLGFGMGYHVEEVIKRFPQKNKIIIEPDLNIFIQCIRCRDITFLAKGQNLLLWLTDNVRVLRDILIELYLTSNIYSLRFIHLASYYTIFGELWRKLQAEFKKFHEGHIVNVRTVKVFKNAWLFNFYNNISRLNSYANFNFYEGKFNSVPAIIVSSGPSLSDNVEYLKNLENKALILAAGSAVTPLMSAGIIPHIMLGIDGAKAMSEVYNEIDREDILFTFVLNHHYDATEKYQGPKLYIRSETESHIEHFEEVIGVKSRGFLSGGSCANIALDVLFHLGCNPIIFIGQDLAYTNMQSHIQGAYGAEDFHDKIKELESDSFYIKTKDLFGNEILTTQVLINMKYCFDAYCTDRKGKRDFINCSANGLPIEGTVHMNIEDAISRYCIKEYQLREELIHIYHKAMKEPQVDIKKVVQFIKDTHSSSEKLKKKSDVRIKLCEKVLENLKKDIHKDYSKDRKKLNKTTEAIEKTELFKHLIWPSCKHLLMVQKNLWEQKALTEEDVKKKLTILYEGLLTQYLEVDEKINVLFTITEDLLQNSQIGGMKNDG